MGKLTNLRLPSSAWRTPVSAQFRNVTTRYANAKLIINAEDIGSTCMPAERDAFVEGSSLDLSMVNPAGRKPTPRTQMVSLLHG
jgi:hypothetical protein